jgi:undecaprenyl-diphosphatase
MSTIQLTVLIVAVIVVVLLLRQLAWFVWRLLVHVARGMSPHLRDWGELSHVHPLRAALTARWPRLYEAMVRRSSPHKFSGLPLTLLAVAALYVLGLIGGLIEDLLQREGIVSFDLAINNFFGPYRTGPLLEVFLWLTALGSSPAIVAVGVVATGFLWADRRAFFVGPLWITFLGAQVTTWAGKLLIGRERPTFIEAVSAVLPSFPSGHATAAMAVYGFLAYALARDVPSARARFELAFWAAVLIALIGFSRIFLSLHYASDVVSGFLVGGFWLLVGFALAEFARPAPALASKTPVER